MSHAIDCAVTAWLHLPGHPSPECPACTCGQKCGRDTYHRDAPCARPAGHEGGCVGPFYVAREATWKPDAKTLAYAADIVRDCAEQGLGLEAAQRAILREVPA